MAASYGHPIGRTSLGGGGSWTEQQLPLPSGACGFRDLSAGAAAPTCGCRRFWLATGVQQGGERAWCFCGHHACFHESVIVSQVGSNQIAHDNVQVNVQGSAGGYIPSQQLAAPTWSQLIGDNTRHESGVAGPTGSTAGLGIRNVSQAPSHSINTRLWHALNGFAREQDNGCISGDTSKLPSTAVPSVVDEPRSPVWAMPDEGQGHHTMGPPPNIPSGLVHEARADQYSATEVATPSLRGTPDFNAFTGLKATAPLASPLERHTPPNVAQNPTLRRVQSSGSSQPRPRPSTAGPSLSIQEMCNTIQNYGRRIDILETISFTHLPSDEVIDRFDMVDGRLLDIEQWRTDQDRAQEADDVDDRIDAVKTRLNELEHWRETESERPAQPSSSMRHLLPETSSFASDGSFDSEAAAQTEAIVLATLAANAETRPRIEALESRIMDLEHATLPSFARPWNVQVVLLPFGRQLPGVWFSSSESTEHSQRAATQTSEEWSGPVASRFAANASFSSDADTRAWTTESIEAWAMRTEDDWLSAKACGPSGVVFKRLESRGLVRDIILTSPDARHICNELANAFGDVLGKSARCEGMDRFQGLQENFIPLRKIRKSSRLRFLGTGEMMSSALWDASLLESSVFMKVNDGERRLYVTTPEAYTQPPHPGWTWQALRSLPMYGADGEVQAAQIIGNVKEKCWTFSDRLDHASSLHSSFASQDSLWGKSSQGSGNGNAASQPVVQQTVATFPPSSSVPISAHAMDIDAPLKRRVASFEIDSSAAVAGVERGQDYMAKRRRVSSSPELERRGVNFTPRWSREPPSPFTSDDIGLARSQAASSRPRGTTPFAYATPHSNLDSRGDDGDTEVDTEPPPLQSENGEFPEEWEGMQEAYEADQNGAYSEMDDLAGHDLFEDDDDLSVFEDDEV